MEAQARAKLPEKLLVSKRDAAFTLSVSPRQIDYMIARGQLHPTRIGSRSLIRRQELLRVAREGA